MMQFAHESIAVGLASCLLRLLFRFLQVFPAILRRARPQDGARHVLRRVRYHLRHLVARGFRFAFVMSPLPFAVWRLIASILHRRGKRLLGSTAPLRLALCGYPRRQRLERGMWSRAALSTLAHLATTLAQVEAGEDEMIRRMAIWFG